MMASPATTKGKVQRRREARPKSTHLREISRQHLGRWPAARGIHDLAQELRCAVRDSGPSVRALRWRSLWR
jgi:hypothetical protein